MRAMIFAAGLGTRFGDITQHIPKCLVEAGGETMLSHVAKALKAAGVGELVINLHHLGAQIKQSVAAQENWGLRVQFSEEEILLETGGGLKKAKPLFAGEERFFIHNSDVYSDISLTEMMSFHDIHKPFATLAVHQRESSRQLLFTPDGLLAGFSNKAKGVRKLFRDCAEPVELSFTGIHVASAKIFEVLETQGEKFSITDTYMEAVARNFEVRAFRVDRNFWIDVGSPEKLKVLQARLGR